MTFPPHAVSTGNGRMYRHPVTGEQVPSVTTIIAALNKPALPRWAAKVATEYAVKHWEMLSGLSDAEKIDLIKRSPWRSSDAAANLGSAVHAAAEAHADGAPLLKFASDVAPYMAQFLDFMDTHKPTFLHTEITVWNRRFGYAGTADWIAEIDGVVTLGDHKTGKGVYPEVALQLGALRRCEFILRADGTEEPMPQVDALAVLHLRPTTWSLIPVADHPQTWRAFLGALALTTWSSGVAQSVLGK